MRASRLPWLLVVTALALPSASLAASAGPPVTTFADGTSTFHLALATDCGTTATPGVALPPEANVTSASLTVNWSVPPSASGSIMFDVGGDGSWDIAAQYGGTPTSTVSLPANRFNAYLAAQPTTPGPVTVPILLLPCGSPAGNATLDHLQVDFAVPPPPANRAPVLTEPLGDVALDAADNHTARVPLAAHFTDPDGDVLTFAFERVDPQDPGWTQVDVSVDGTDLVVSAPPDGSGEVFLTVTASDPAGLSFTSAPVRVAATADPPPPTPTGSPPSGEPAPPPLPAAGAAALLAGVALAGVGALLAVERPRFAALAALLGLLGAARRAPSPTDHFVRGRLYQLVRDRPGVRFRELIRDAEVSNGAGVHHLRVLEQAGFVQVVRTGGQTQFFPSDHPFREEDYRLLDYERALLETVSRRPGITVREVAQAAGISRSTASRAVARLTRSGHLTRHRRGRHASLRLREGGAGPGGVPSASGPGRAETGGPAP